MEVYYSYDLNKPINQERPPFIYSFDRHNEVALNLGYVLVSYSSGKTRANLGLLSGTYANSNLQSEPGVFQNVLEANIGVRLSETQNLWFDAGIFPSHIGFESAKGADCWNLTRSILADNSPYYESGLKFSYSSRQGTWYISGLFLNGWQRMQRLEGNNTPAFGWQVKFSPTTSLQFNSSSFIGTDSPDSARLWRYFHNFYSQIDVSKKLGLILGFDIGAQQNLPNQQKLNLWYSPVVIVAFKPTEKYAIAVRGEYYSDKHEIMVDTNTASGFRVWSGTLNLDYHISKDVLWRVEFRSFHSPKAIFTDGNGITKNNASISSSLCLGI